MASIDLTEDDWLFYHVIRALSPVLDRCSIELGIPIRTDVRLILDSQPSKKLLTNMTVNVS
jgi:hypothetical protein